MALAFLVRSSRRAHCESAKEGKTLPSEKNGRRQKSQISRRLLTPRRPICWYTDFCIGAPTIVIGWKLCVGLLTPKTTYRVLC